MFPFSHPFYPTFLPLQLLYLMYILIPPSIYLLLHPSSHPDILQIIHPFINPSIRPSIFHPYTSSFHLWFIFRINPRSYLSIHPSSYSFLQLSTVTFNHQLLHPSSPLLPITLILIVHHLPYTPTSSWPTIYLPSLRRLAPEHIVYRRHLYIFGGFTLLPTCPMEVQSCLFICRSLGLCEWLVSAIILPHPLAQATLLLCVSYSALHANFTMELNRIYS